MSASEPKKNKQPMTPLEPPTTPRPAGSPPAQPGAQEDPEDRKPIQAEVTPGEAAVMFPMTPTSDVRSPYFAESYIYPFNPDPLCAGNRYDTYDEMRRDQQVKSCLGLKKDLATNSGWEIEDENPTAKEEMESDLRDMSDEETADSGFEDSLRAIMSAYDYGFSLTEVVAKLDEGRYKPKSLRTRPPHSFQFDLDDKGNIRKLLQYGAKGPKELNPKHFIHHVYQSDFGNPYGTADLQAAHTPWKAKKFFIRMYAVYVERFASPTVVARYKPGAQEDEIAVIQRMARSVANSTAMTLPEDVAVDFVQAARDATEAYVRGIALWDMMIARALLVPDLMGVSGEKTGGGSLSLGETQFKLFLGTIQKDRQSLERKVNLRLVRPLAQLNYGTAADPRLKLMPWSDDNMGKNMELWLKAVSLNTYVPHPDEIDYFRRSIKFPTPPVEVTAGLPEPTPPGGGFPGKPGEDKGDAPAKTPKPEERPRGPMTGGGKPTKPGDKKADTNEPRPERKLSSESGRLLIFRDLTNYERKVDFAMIKRALDVGERGLERAVGDAAARMRDDLMRQIRDQQFLKRFNPEALAALQPAGSREMNQALRSEFRGLFRASVDEARLEILPDARKFASEDMLPEEFERILEAESFALVGNYRTDLTKRATARLVAGIKSGTPEGKLTALLREDLADYGDKWVSTLTRTKTTEIYNTARKSVWDTDEVIKQIVEAYQYSAVLDERTSDVCRHLDGKIFEKGAFVDQAMPPLHFNCRTILVPVTKFETYTASKPESLAKLKDMGGNLIQA